MNSLSHFVQDINETEKHQWEDFFLTYVKNVMK